MIKNIQELRDLISSIATEDLESICELPQTQLEHLFGVDYGRQNILFDEKLYDESLDLDDEIQDWLETHIIEFKPMTFETIEELDTYLGKIGWENVSYFDGECQNFISAVIGLDHHTKRVVYDYDKMVEYLMEENKDEEWYHVEDAIEWIDYNTVRSLPYFQNSPIIISQEQTDYIKS